jgi:hypothetical protein
MKILIESPWRWQKTKKYAKEHDLALLIDDNGKTMYDYFILEDASIEELLDILEDLGWNLYGGFKVNRAENREGNLEWVIAEKDVYYD